MEMGDGHEHTVKQDSVSPDEGTKGAGTVLSPEPLHCPQHSQLQKKLSQSTFGKVIERIVRRNSAQLGLEQTDLLLSLPTTTNATVAAGRNTERHHRHPGPALCVPLLSKDSPCMASPEGFCRHHRLSSPRLVVSKVRQSCKQDLTAPACSSGPFY